MQTKSVINMKIAGLSKVMICLFYVNVNYSCMGAQKSPVQNHDFLLSANIEVSQLVTPILYMNMFMYISNKDKSTFVFSQILSANNIFDSFQSSWFEMIKLLATLIKDPH